MIAVVALIILAAVAVAKLFHDSRQGKRAADRHRRDRMRQVTESWHFREWERDVRSSDSR